MSCTVAPLICHRSLGVAQLAQRKLNMVSKILIVEDEPDIVELLAYHLNQAEFETEAVSNGRTALNQIKANPPDLILLDLLLPEVNGLEICRLLKQNASTAGIPVIILTAKGEEIDRIVGFDLGVDDYITKPFSSRQVVLRIRAALRRPADTKPSKPSKLVAIHGLTIDLDKHQVFSEDGAISLTATEFKLLGLFTRSAGRVFTRNILMDAVWQEEYYGIDRTVDTHINRLRRKLGRFGELIETVRGIGYRFKE